MAAPVIRGALLLEEPLAASVVTLGTFDGVHRGHQELIARARERAERLNVPAVAYTFDPHPAKLLAPDRAPKVLVPTEERIRILLELGIDTLVVEPFDRAFSEVSADDWLARYLVARLRPRHVVVGFNFTYGRGRGGDGDHLLRYGAAHGFSVEVVPAVSIDGQVVSSTAIREALGHGELEQANLMLGRPFTLTGKVVEGDRRGRTIQVPTANLAADNELVPRTGVYVSRVTLDDGQSFGAVTNIGTRPTFSGTLELRIESHLLGFDGDLYGRAIRVALLHFLRPEKKFEGIDGLVAQIRRDIEEAKLRLGHGAP